MLQMAVIAAGVAPGVMVGRGSFVGPNRQDAITLKNTAQRHLSIMTAAPATAVPTWRIVESTSKRTELFGIFVLRLHPLYDPKIGHEEL
jgi:hypothetical protein